MFVELPAKKLGSRFIRSVSTLVNGSCRSMYQVVLILIFSNVSVRSLTMCVQLNLMLNQMK